MFSQRALNPGSGFGGLAGTDKNKKETVSALPHLDPSGFRYYLSQ
jgi:hypothetical protein